MEDSGSSDLGSNPGGTTTAIRPDPISRLRRPLEVTVPQPGVWVEGALPSDVCLGRPKHYIVRFFRAS